MEFSFCDTFYWIPIFYPQGDPLGIVQSPKTNFMLNLNKFSTISHFFILRLCCVGLIKIQNFVWGVTPTRQPPRGNSWDSNEMFFKFNILYIIAFFLVFDLDEPVDMPNVTETYGKLKVNICSYLQLRRTIFLSRSSINICIWICRSIKP